MQQTPKNKVNCIIDFSSVTVQSEEKFVCLTNSKMFCFGRQQLLAMTCRDSAVLFDDTYEFYRSFIFKLIIAAVVLIAFVSEYFYIMKSVNKFTSKSNVFSLRSIRLVMYF